MKHLPRPWRDGALRMLALAARPVRRAQGRGELVIEPYRGYGSTTQAFLIGRVFRQRRVDPSVASDDVRTHLRDMARRICRRVVAGVPMVGRLGDAEQRVYTDRDGYLRLHLLGGDAPHVEGDWHAVDLTLDLNPPVRAQGRIFIPSARSRLAIVSDIDDTVTETGVANKLVMLWRLFVATADSRVAFPGVAAFYRALHAGGGAATRRTRSCTFPVPHGAYDMLTAFFRRHSIPVGPEMFLREWGLSWRHPWPRRAKDHKRELIGNMMVLYSDLPFVLIGDSGQHDPEVYAQIVRENLGRVTAIYIRNVSREAARLGEIARLTEAVSSTAAASSWRRTASRWRGMRSGSASCRPMRSQPWSRTGTMIRCHRPIATRLQTHQGPDEGARREGGTLARPHLGATLTPDRSRRKRRRDPDRAGRDYHLGE